MQIKFSVMKIIVRVLMLLLLLNASSIIEPQKASAQVSVGFQVFYDQMSPYGSWVNYPEYGYAWIPNASVGFSPYSTGGHWVFTQFGWMWVSDYPWGWAAFHYGSWYMDPMYGWMWIPGYEWAPAWVVWSSAPGYYGWAPIGPRVNVNVVINGGYRIPANQWVYVPAKYIASPDISRYYGPRTNNTALIQKSTIINNTYVDNSTHVTYVKGPDRNEVQKVTGQNIEPAAVKAMDKPGERVSKNEVEIYRPHVTKEAAGNNQVAPKKVVELQDVKAAQEHQEINNQKQAEPKAAPSKQQVQPKQPPHQNEQQKKQKPKDSGPNPKTMQQPVHPQYDYALKQESQSNQIKSSVVPKQNMMPMKSQVAKNSTGTEIAKNRAQMVKQSPNKKMVATYQEQTVANSKQQTQVQKQAVISEQKQESGFQSPAKKQAPEVKKKSPKE